MKQQQLFKPSRREASGLAAAAPFQRHSNTSRRAAETIEPRAGTLRHVVLMFLRERGDRGATDEEMQQALDMGANTQRPRRIELIRNYNPPLIEDSGETRKTKSGSEATVWKATNQQQRGK